MSRTQAAEKYLAAVDRLKEQVAKLERELTAARIDNARLRNLISEHHAVGALDGALVGNRCPICAKEEA